jgi:D-alanyl-D-alanine carboxypeptidase/D-alanyl-D-alanine-endopeptidase (penicillin-binding protein 4)
MRTALFLLLLSTPFMAFSQLIRLEQAVEELNKDSGMRSAVWSICVRDAKSGELLLGKDEEKSLVTASTMKAVTSATALAILGPDYRFQTYLEHDGEIKEDGVLEGNLYLRGTGDPTLGSDRFGEEFEVEKVLSEWTKKLQEAGIKRIDGKVMADASYFSSQLTPGNWNWEDMGNYYGAGASGLNVYENFYTLYLKPGARQGAPATVVRTFPRIPGLQFNSELRTGAPGSGDNAWIYGSPYTLQRYLRGTIPLGPPIFKIKGSIPDPGFLLAYELVEALTSCDIFCQGYAALHQAGARKGRKRLHTHYSPPLREILTPLNQKSINLYAECLLKAMGKKAGKEGSTAEGVEVLLEHWEAKGIETKGLYVRDGSGLSANNAVSTSFMTEVLAKAFQEPYGEVLKKSFPLAGRSGSLKGMLRGTAAEGRLYAKSGYLSGVRGYAGYVTTADGRELTFAMLANQYACSAGQMRRKFERLMALVAAGK